MSPQHSNREALIEGALLCIEEKPAANVTARDISAASGANLASIAYHFGSKDSLLALALEEGFRRWLGELAAEMGDLAELGSAKRLERASGCLRAGVERHRGLLRAFFAALARASHDDHLRAVLARSYAESRQAVATLLDLGNDDAGLDAASLLIATFDGLLIQALVDETQRPGPATIRRSGERLVVQMSRPPSSAAASHS